ncbi:hypothetical protein [Streptomyces sp.]|uniref:hypothetical protein n=1 Tax=Streptomyces sp. TaxID=1931 RepID=UPI0039C8F8C7
MTRGRSPSFEAVLLGGLPVRGPMMRYGPLTVNTYAEPARAFDDCKAGRLGPIPADTDLGR